MALLTQYMLLNSSISLEDYLEKYIFKDEKTTTLKAEKEDVLGFETYIKDYKKLLEVERKAVETL